MESRTLKYVAEACAGQVVSGSPELSVNRVCIDSRQTQPGDLFVALKGERFDGHQYVAEVAQKQAAAVLVDRSKLTPTSRFPGRLGLIAVDDTRAALGALAARYRRDFRLAVVAVGGSNGKTTTKELLAAVLRRRFHTLWSPASYNNDIGVPLTLLQLERRHQAGVLEVGTNHPGELAPLVRMAQPQFGVLTNVGREHLEFFGDIAGVVQEEGCLAEGLPAFGKLFVHGDNEWTPLLAQRTAAMVLTVGFGPSNEWRAQHLRVGEDGVTFEVITARAEYSGEYRIQLLGRHQVPNALLALAVGTELGVPPEQLRQGLAECQPPPHRLQIKYLNGIGVLNDAYNANADSMQAALQTLRDLPCGGRRVAVLGDMAELGAAAQQAHREVGQRVAELGIDLLVAIGDWAEEMAAAAHAAGLHEARACADVPLATDVVKSSIRPGDLVLIKASRKTGLEGFERALVADHHNAPQ